MTPKEIELRAKKFRRLRTLGDANPFCRPCGQNDWWVRFERHHPGRRKFSPALTVLVCGNCHDELSILQEDLKVTDHLNPETRRHVLMLEGQADLMRLAADCLLEAAQHMRGSQITPRDLPEFAEDEQ